MDFKKNLLSSQIQRESLSLHAIKPNMSGKFPHRKLTKIKILRDIMNAACSNKLKTVYIYRYIIIHNTHQFALEKTNDSMQGSYRIKFKDFSRTFPGLLKSFSSTWLLLSRRSQCLYLSFCNQFSLKMHFPIVI